MTTATGIKTNNRLEKGIAVMDSFMKIMILFFNDANKVSGIALSQSFNTKCN